MGESLNYDAPLEVFLQSLLKLQCEVSDACSAAIVQPGPEQNVGVVCVHPAMDKQSTPPLWLSHIASTLKRGDWPSRQGFRPIEIEGQGASDSQIKGVLCFPVPHLENRDALAVYTMRSHQQHDVETAVTVIETCFAHLSTYLATRALKQRERDVEGLTHILQLQVRANEHAKFHAAAMALCNELTTRYHLERASLGLIHGQDIRIRAMSQTEHINRRMNLVQRLEAAMEECYDQDTEILYPSSEHATIACRMTRQLAQEFGPSAVCSVPLRYGGSTQGVLTLERDQQNQFTLEQLREIRILIDLSAPRLLERYQEDRWLGARLATRIRHGLGIIIGPQYTWVKLASLAIIALLVFMMFVQGPDRIDADFKIEAVKRQIIPAPFEGFIETVHVKPGDDITANQTVLATLDVSEFQAQLAKLEAQLATHLKEADIARQDGKESQVQIAEARADQTRSEIASVRLKIAQSALRSSLSGIVIAGDLEDQLGAPVSRGDVLFEVAPPDSLRAELYIPDHRIGELRVDQRGELATSSHPDDSISFVVESIYPMAEVIDQQNVFRVKVKLADKPTWLRPGVEGLAKVNVGRKPYGILWTRDVWNWVRMQLWI